MAVEWKDAKMFHKHKPLREQVIVITGASSGIGLTTAEMAAKKGAKVVLTARTEEKLRKICENLRKKGRTVAYIPADVGDPADVARVVHFAEQTYGRIDTWVNNAGLAIFGKLEAVEIKDAKRLFDTNFWGMVHGCEAVLPSMRQTGGGVIINVGSVLADRSIPLQGFYAASKHAVKAYTDSLRMELEMADEPIDICLIKPTSVNTPYTHHAKNLTECEPTLPPPVYAPEVVARAILDCAVRPRRDIYVGGAARGIHLVANLLPRVNDKLEEAAGLEAQTQGRSEDAPWEGHLHEGEPNEEPERYGNIKHHVARWSLYTSARLHPLRTALLAALGLGALAMAGRRAITPA